MDRRTLHVVLGDGTQLRFQVPVDAKITLGGLNPSSGHSHSANPTLRVYHTDKQQIMAIQGVRHFWDLAVDLEWSKKGETKWHVFDEDEIQF